MCSSDLGLVLYWCTSNLWQIGQQYFMLRSRPTAETLRQQGAKKATKKGMMERAMERAEEERKSREQGRPPKRGKDEDEGRR